VRQISQITGANRLGASALIARIGLMVSFVAPYTIGDYLAQNPTKKVDDSSSCFWPESLDNAKAGIEKDSSK